MTKRPSHKPAFLRFSLDWPAEFGSRKHAVDPGPNVWELNRKPDETNVEAAFRRFPINSHKPGNP